MRHNSKVKLGSRISHMRKNNALARSKAAGGGVPRNTRARVRQSNPRLPFVPPEDWHEPADEPTPGYRVIVQEAGRGFRHVVTPEEVKDRLAQLPARFLRPLEVLQFSRMTRKKQSFPCYGMQWGSTLYLYPIEESLVEYYYRPPQPNQVTEARMYGGRWEQEGRSCWKLVWTEETIRDFYLNNILIHELGHLLDDRNTSYVQRERFAEWFALEYGYKASTRAVPRKERIVRRHHASSR